LSTQAVVYVVARTLFASQRRSSWKSVHAARFVWFRAAVWPPFPFLAAAIAMLIGKP
jgi:hypothetical protein